MRMTSLQILLAFSLTHVGFALDGKAQELLSRRVNISAQNQGIEVVLKQIQKQADVQFLFSREIIQSKRKISYQTTNEQLSLVLNQILTPLNLTYEVVGPQILIKRAVNQTTVPQPTSSELKTGEAQDVQITGRVVGESGEGLPGVNVQIKSTTRGTTTDGNGSYKLSIPDGAGTSLIFSFIGYATQEVAVGNQSVINVTLATDNKTLNEVVVVGYGTQRKTSLTGAIASVSNKEISVLPVSNISQSLQGRAAGVTVTNNGAPGEAPIIRIRGVGTINNANPLYVVDGVPVGDGSNVDPKDVQSIEVLKDASAAAIYGSRAANGVILITTKRSNSKKLSVTIDSYVGVQSAWRKLPLLNRDQYIAYGTDLLNNGDIYGGKPAGTSIPPRWQTGLDQPIYAGATQTFRQTETDWQDEMFRNATIQQHRLELTGGNEVSKFYLSGGFFSQDGIMIGTNYKRGNIRLNTDHKLGKKVTIGQTLYLAYDDRRIEQNGGSIGTQIRNIVNTIPYLPVYNPNNIGGFEGSKNVDGTDPANPVRNALLNSNKSQSNTVFSTLFVDVELIPGLKYRFQGGINIFNSIGRTVNPSYDSGPGG